MFDTPARIWHGPGMAWEDYLKPEEREKLEDLRRVRKEAQEACARYRQLVKSRAEYRKARVDKAENEAQNEGAGND